MKVKNILALITNILLIALGAIPVVLTIIEQPTFDYLTLGTHLPYVVFCLLVLVSLWGVINNIVALARNKEVNCGVYSSLRLGVLTLSYLSAGCLPFVYMAGTPFEVNLEFISICIVPVCLTIVYLLLDTTSKKQHFCITLSSLILPLAYFGSMIALYETKVITAYPYQFMNYMVDGKLHIINLITYIGLAIAPFLFSILLWLISNAISKKTVEEPVKEVTPEPVKEETKVKKTTSKTTKTTTTKAKESKTTETKKSSSTTKKEPAKKKETSKAETKKTETKKAAPTKKDAAQTKKVSETKPEETKTSSEPGYRIYHITKRTDVNMWQVKFAKGLKAIKLFKTQQEAIDFAKELAEKNGASIRLHGVNGKIRKI